MAKARPLQCPFCDNYLKRPIDIRLKDLEILGGICPCGSVYVLDRTGHQLGQIYMDALCFACKGDFEKALSLDPEDYEDIDLNYDFNSNTTGRGRTPEKTGKLLFLRLKMKKSDAI
ncbi:MAG: hypothetical protein HY809_03545 [Nitrospirae bacterium]|nr:hypothetical protein [Nitrospirota bacterium]